MRMAVLGKNFIDIDNFKYDEDNLFKLELIQKPETILQKVKHFEMDLVLIDWKGNKKELFTLIEEIDGQVPIIIIGSKPLVTEVIDCLKRGVEDFVTRPISKEELKARILNRCEKFSQVKKNTSSNILKVDPISKKAFLGNTPLLLSEQDFSTLQVLLRNKGKTVTRDMIIHELKGGTWEVMDRSIDNTIARIRKMIGCNPKSPKYIRSIRGEGYMFIGSFGFFE